ncbi:FAD binding domain-containing protein [Alicyclobacillus sp. ALC3]|uniref:FAD binding domain-containing protein n=1 Tax=Alicyclobacillus sp. ALC3 TaxID=2796143 RepID=UPI0023785F4D|nr:xanthine dehydrogenase family protein subunit M [Alicyclobacillus sp. ALC3]WDL97142.1 xanthine dehydrogenase family protein subunit M [Alicyclobacillus sp. ALC3]
MIPSAFAYSRATSLQDALMQLQSHEDAKLLAGGHSLLPLMKMRLANPAKLVDLGGLKEELRGVRREGDRLIVGALTTHSEVAHSKVVQETLPALSEAARQVGDLQVRNRGTVGGNIAHADPASDLPAIALAFDAEIAVATLDGTEVIPAHEYFLGPLLTALPEHGLVTHLSFVLPETGTNSVYEKYPHPASGYAVVGVAAAGGVGTDGTVSHIRVALTGAGEVAYRASAVESALAGQTPTEDTILAAAAHAAEDGDIAGDLFASEEYRRHLCQVYTARALRRVFASQLA